MLGKQIKKCRAKAKLTQLELGKMLGVGKSNISMYESGTRVPPLDIIKKMTEIFNVDMNYLIGYQENKSPTAQELSDGELKLLQLFKEVPEDQQEMLLEMIEVALKNRR